MKVSIIIPCYNSSKNLSNLRISVEEYLNNNDYEVIFIDDKSRDDERKTLCDFIDSLNANNIILILNNINVGASVSRKNGVEIAKGEYIAFLDSDDAWHKSKIIHQYGIMQDNKIDILGGRVQVVDFVSFNSLNNVEISKIKIKKINFNRFLFKNYYSTPSVMVARRVILSENFSDKLRYSEDYDCWRRISLRYRSYYMPDSYTYSFKHDYLSNGNSLSSNLLKMSIGELKGLFLIYKKKLDFYQYLLIAIAIVYSLLKAFWRMFRFYTR